MQVKLKAIGIGSSILLALAGCHPSGAPASAKFERPPSAATTNMGFPSKNPFLADGLSQTSHFRPDQQDSLAVPGPTGIHEPDELTVQTVPGGLVNLVYLDRQPYPGSEHNIYAPNNNRVAKIRVDGGSFRLVSEIRIDGPQPHFTQQDAEALTRTLDSLDSEQAILGYLNEKFPRYAETSVVGGGIYNVSDKDGVLFTLSRGKILAFGDREPAGPESPLVLLRSLDLSRLLSAPVGRIPDAILGLNITHDGNLVFCTISGLVGVVDRQFKNEPVVLRLADEMITNGMATDNQGGIYVVTSRMMHKLVWNGTRLSDDSADGAWSSPYDVAPPSGGVMLAGGSGSTPSLMGFGTGDDRLVVISDGAEVMNVVAFWRDEIPQDFQQRPGTKSRRIAGQIRIDFGDPEIKKVQSEQSVAVLGYGAVVVNNVVPDPLPTMLESVVASGRLRPGPKGIEKVIWNPQTDSWQVAWTNYAVGSPSTVPMISAGSNQVYTNRFADGNWEIVGLSWDTGQVLTRVKLGNSHTYNGAYSLIHLMENGDLFLGGLLGVHRIAVPSAN